MGVDDKDKAINQIKTDQSIPSFFIRFEKLELYVVILCKKIIIFTSPNFIGVVCVNIIIDITKVKNYDIIYLIIPIKKNQQM